MKMSMNKNVRASGSETTLMKVLRKIRRGESEPFYERFVLEQLNLRKTKETV
jgi:hypothetical protein